MTLLGMRRSLLAMAGMVFVFVMGGWLWLGKAAISQVWAPALFMFYLLVLLAIIVERVDHRISALEDKLKQDPL